MKSIHKGIFAVSLAGSLGIATYDVQDRVAVQKRIDRYRAHEETLTAELAALEKEREVARTQLGQVPETDENLGNRAADIYKLRDQITRLQTEPSQRISSSPSESTEARLAALLSRASALKGLAERYPKHAIPEIAWMKDDDWMELAKFDRADEMENEAVGREMFKEVRRRAKLMFGNQLYRALQKSWEANEGAMPADLSELRPYFSEPVSDAVLERYELLKRGRIQDIRAGEATLVERAPADLKYDTRFVLEGTNKITTGYSWQDRLPGRK